MAARAVRVGCRGGDKVARSGPLTPFFFFSFAGGGATPSHFLLFHPPRVQHPRAPPPTYAHAHTHARPSLMPFLTRLASRALAPATAWASTLPLGIGATAAASSSAAARFSTSSPSTPPPPSSSELNALLYRARQRGFLELDLLLGRWAEQHAAGLDAGGRAALSDLLAAENPDLFSWLTGQAPPPPHIATNPVFTAIAGGVAERLAAGAPAAARAPAGVAWKKGWDDKGK